MSFAVVRVGEGDESARALYLEALREAGSQRGGAGLLRDLARVVGDAEPEGQYARLTSSEGLLACREGDQLIGVAALSAPTGTILGIFVAPQWRRRGAATALLGTLLATEPRPNDAWALPGDRATKSLFEKTGWKARRLTMSAE